MKAKQLSIVVFLCSFGVQAQNLHIPPCQGSAHEGPICWGYATGRAFGVDYNSSPCSASDLNFTQIHLIYFNKFAPASYTALLNSIQVGASLDSATSLMLPE